VKKADGRVPGPETKNGLDAWTLQAERKFLWIRRKIPRAMQGGLHEIGEPGLLFAPRDSAFYPNGHWPAHIMGGGQLWPMRGVHAAEVSACRC